MHYGGEHPGLGGIDLSLGGLERLLGLIKLGTGREALLEQALLARKGFLNAP